MRRHGPLDAVLALHYRQPGTVRSRSAAGIRSKAPQQHGKEPAAACDKSHADGRVRIHSRSLVLDPHRDAEALRYTPQFTLARFGSQLQDGQTPVQTTLSLRLKNSAARFVSE